MSKPARQLARPALISPPDQRLVTLDEDSRCTHCCAAGTAALRPGSAEWLRLARRARLLSWISLGWLGIEGGIAILAAILAGSVVLLGFGIDSAIEALASIIVVWRFSSGRTLSDRAETRAQRAVAFSFFLLVPRRDHAGRTCCVPISRLPYWWACWPTTCGVSGGSIRPSDCSLRCWRCEKVDQHGAERPAHAARTAPQIGCAQRKRRGRRCGLTRCSGLRLLCWSPGCC